MKKIFFYIICLFVLVGCQDERFSMSSSSSQELSKLYATTSAVVKSRSMLHPDNSVSWGENDMIGVYSDTRTRPVAYRYVNDSGNLFLPEDSLVSGSHYYAVYPFNSDCEMEGSKISLSLPAMQEYTVGSFDPKACPLVAQSSDNQFQFLQTTGLIRLKLKGSMTVHKIQLEGNNGEKLAGPGSIDISSQTPAFQLDSTSMSLASSIYLQGLSVTLEEEKDTSFYFVVPVQIFEKGITFHITGCRKGMESEIEIVKRSDKVLQVSRAVINSLSGLDVDKELTPEELSQKETLIALYDATDGDNWYFNDNWCTDAPLSEWYGVSIGADGKVCSLNLPNNQLKGSLPEEIGLLTGIERLDLHGNWLSGEFPEALFNLTHLSTLDLSDNQLSGTLPSSIGKLNELYYLFLSSNNFTGSLPEELGSLSNLGQVELSYNQFEGIIPEKISRSQWWQQCGWCNLYQNGNGFDLESTNLYLPDFTETDMNGNLVNSTEIIRSHELTLYFLWNPGPNYFMTVIPSIYRKFKDYGLAVFGGTCIDGEQDREMTEYYISEYKMEWPTLTKFQPYPQMSEKKPAALLFNKEGKLVYHSDHTDISLLKGIIEELLGDHFNPYVSTDYEQDGKSVLLQSAKTGNGVNVVFLGDGFSDRQIADGTYDQVMRWGMEAFFSVQPYSYFRDYFTVYYVNVVSKNEGYIEDGETGLHCSIQDDGTIYCSDDLCKTYALKSGVTDYADDDIGRQLLVVTILNSPEYTGTCNAYAYMFHQDGDHSVGWSVAYVARADDAEVFQQILRHEACGHGFAKLGDEYSSLDAVKSRAVVPNEVSYYCSIYGWFKNIYVEDASGEVNWEKFMEDARYQPERLGLYEGAYGQANNYFRPTETSVMRDAMGGFNAPSREAIYYRIHKLAFGTTWEYDYESFVKWDQEYGMPSFLNGRSRSLEKRFDIKLGAFETNIVK